MAENTYLVRLKGSPGALQRVEANRYEMHGKNLVFVTEDGKVAALFAMDIIDSFDKMNT